MHSNNLTQNPISSTCISVPLQQQIPVSAVVNNKNSKANSGQILQNCRLTVPPNTNGQRNTGTFNTTDQQKVCLQYSYRLLL